MANGYIISVSWMFSRECLPYFEWKRGDWELATCFAFGHLHSKYIFYAAPSGHTRKLFSCDRMDLKFEIMWICIYFMEFLETEMHVIIFYLHKQVHILINTQLHKKVTKICKSINVRGCVLIKGSCSWRSTWGHKKHEIIAFCACNFTSLIDIRIYSKYNHMEHALLMYTIEQFAKSTLII